MKKQWTKAINTEWTKECPKCGKVMYYSSRNNLNKAIRANRSCMNCKNDFTDEYRKKISDTLNGRPTGNRQTRKNLDVPKVAFRNCPNCNIEMGYARRDLMLRAQESNAVCNSCSCKIYKKSWTHVIKNVHVQKMAASKAGYESFDEYMADLDTKKKYYRKVRRISKQQDISVLDNFDKLRGLCGVEDAYQLDHIIPISEGYRQNIDPEVIGHISNLQIIPWQENLRKSNNS